MVTFLCILVMFLLGYGVASQSLLFPDQDFGWFPFKNALVVPYFQIYGELYLDAIQHGMYSCKCSERFSLCYKLSPRVSLISKACCTLMCYIHVWKKVEITCNGHLKM